MHVIGTAGHIDHGKSTLIKALTGIHPDRLKEEREREMTIDLGFAWLTLLNQEEVGIIDVPGHRDFIGNMLAGVGGIEAALFVIAADEGVMPQTREHLAILDLLQIKTGIIVLTKIDLIDDEEWLDLVEMDVRDVFQDTVLAGAPIVRVSAVQGSGIDHLKEMISDMLSHTPERSDLGRARLSVDRVFSITGFGTVVTGTLLDGIFSVGDEVEVLPSKDKARIRGLQTHKTKENVAIPGSRTAINLSGIESSQINRGDVITLTKKYQPTQRFDAQVNVLKDVSSGLRHNQEVKLFVGAKEVQARVRVLGADEISPGEEGWIQIEPKEPVVVVRSDRFILRRPSPGETIGGGRIVNPHPQKRHKRFSSNIINQLEAYLIGSPEDVIYQACLDMGYCKIEDLQKKSRLESNVIQKELAVLQTKKMILNLSNPGETITTDSMICCKIWLESITKRSIEIISDYHKQYPLRKGIPREELKSRLKVDQKLYLLLLSFWQNESEILSNQTTVQLADFKIVYRVDQQKKISELLAQFDQNPFSPPGVKECILIVGSELFRSLLEEGILVEVNNEVVFRKETYEKLVSEIKKEIMESGSITVARFRDMFSTSRKYALGLLEYLDTIGVTVREGDQRKLRNSPYKR